MNGFSPEPVSVAPPGLALNAKPTGGAALRLAPGYWLRLRRAARAVTLIQNEHSDLEAVLFSEQESVHPVRVQPL